MLVHVRGDHLCRTPRQYFRPIAHPTAKVQHAPSLHALASEQVPFCTVDVQFVPGEARRDAVFAAAAQRGHVIRHGKVGIQDKPIRRIRVRLHCLQRADKGSGDQLLPSLVEALQRRGEIQVEIPVMDIDGDKLPDHSALQVPMIKEQVCRV
jgi:hypothetical protein